MRAWRTGRAGRSVVGRRRQQRIHALKNLQQRARQRRAARRKNEDEAATTQQDGGGGGGGGGGGVYIYIYMCVCVCARGEQAGRWTRTIAKMGQLGGKNK